MAGIAQAVPEIKGTILFPDKPNFRIILSIKNTTRLIYPLSSKTEINRNKKAICGIKIIIPPMPGMIPSESKSVNFPCGRLSLVKALNFEKVVSIKSIGMLLQSKID